MEKALILLKDFEESFKDATIVQEGELERNGISWILYVREAISELEEAMKPKTCKGCKQSCEPNNQTFHKYFCEYLKTPIHGDFYCNRYKQKNSE